MFSWKIVVIWFVIVYNLWLDLEERRFPYADNLGCNKAAFYATWFWNEFRVGASIAACGWAHSSGWQRDLWSSFLWLDSFWRAAAQDVGCVLSGCKCHLIRAWFVEQWSSLRRYHVRSWIVLRSPRSRRASRVIRPSFWRCFIEVITHSRIYKIEYHEGLNSKGKRI